MKQTNKTKPKIKSKTEINGLRLQAEKWKAGDEEITKQSQKWIIGSSRKKCHLAVLKTKI